MENLWENIKIEKVTTPIDILQNQADYLKEYTRGLVYASLERNNFKETLENTSDFFYDFYIKGKNVKDYRYKLFTIQNPIELYPVTIFLDTKLFDEISNGIKKFIKDKKVVIDTEEEYINVLKWILSANRVQEIITGIISLKDDYDDDILF
ncbi:hypothetical protein [Clostridium sporogenes]|uniref:hypothetical protein n=1 Tax=Clostridium sporogenes TaxID=1509 RepID=UPI0022383F4C|nr:hypothetical protein [Clostridium sporogenes]MCW6088843.1 hypothetical protein [Clostridium sporogenes]